jgi:predicted permease
MVLDFTTAMVVSLQSMGTFIVMLFAGLLLRKTGNFPEDVSKGLAKISLNVTIPCLLFVSVLDCEQDYSLTACPNLLHYVMNGWPLLVWPVVVVGLGTLLAQIIVLPFGDVPANFQKTAVVAVAFGNSTGMPITLLSAIHNSFNPRKDPLGIVDPTHFVAVYLLLYPLLQWSVGGYMIGLHAKPPVPSDSKHNSTCIAETELDALSAKSLLPPDDGDVDHAGADDSPAPSHHMHTHKAPPKSPAATSALGSIILTQVFQPPVQTGAFT